MAVQLLTLQPALIFLPFADEWSCADAQLYCSCKGEPARVLAWLCVRAGVADGGSALMRAWLCARASAALQSNLVRCRRLARIQMVVAVNPFVV